MLLDSIDRLHLYADKIPHLAEGLACLNEHINDTEDGRYEFEGGFIMIQTGTCKDLANPDFEAHRNYVDVQCLLSGEEWFEWCDIREMEVKVPYDPGKDKEVVVGSGSTMMLRPGMAVLFWPNDAHKPGSCPGGGAPFHKAVVKLKLD